MRCWGLHKMLVSERSKTQKHNELWLAHLIWRRFVIGLVRIGGFKVVILVVIGHQLHSVLRLQKIQFAVNAKTHTLTFISHSKPGSLGARVIKSPSRSTLLGMETLSAWTQLQALKEAILIFLLIDRVLLRALQQKGDHVVFTQVSAVSWNGFERERRRSFKPRGEGCEKAITEREKERE